MGPSAAAPSLRVFRVAALFWLAAWLSRSDHLVPHFWDPVRLEHPLFPAAFLSPLVSAVLFALPLLAGLLLVRSERRAMQAAALLLVVSAAGLALHVDTHNDATFVTSFWVSLWLLWLSFRSGRSEAGLGLEGCLLAQCVVGTTFLGGAVGKLTPEYWSGESLYGLYVLAKENWPYPWLRENVAPELLRLGARWLSRAAIALELALALLPLWPRRIATLAAPALMAGLVAISTPRLFSVMGSLIGMLLACRIWLSREDAAARS